MVALKSTVKRMQSFNLPHDPCCGSKCVCVSTIFTAHDHNPKTGRIGMRRVPRKICPSLSVGAMETVKDLPDSVLDAPEIKAAMGKTLALVDKPSIAKLPPPKAEEKK